MNRVEACLEDMGNRIDPAVEDRLLEKWTAFTEGRFPGDIFAPKRIRRIPPGADWPTVSGIRLLGFDRAQARAALAAGRPLRGCVHCH